MSSKLLIDADTSWLDAFAEQHGRQHLIAFSRGKDSIASWLVLRDHGIEVAPYHSYLVPGLEFVDESIAYFERVFGCKIVQLPHRSLWRMLDEMVYQPPTRLDAINDLNPRTPTFLEVQALARSATRSPTGSMVASGVRACDSIPRRFSFIRYGHVRIKQEVFYPVWNWRKADVLDAMHRNNVDLPPEYAWFSPNGDPTRGRSFDGIDARFLVPIKKHRPRDYQRILEWFPLAEIEVYRYELLRA